MMGPDYTQWHGNFEVAHRFYMEFVPQLREVLHKAASSPDRVKVEAARKVQAELDLVLNSQTHRWFLGKMPPAEREARPRKQIQNAARQIPRNAGSPANRFLLRGREVCRQGSNIGESPTCFLDLRGLPGLKADAVLGTYLYRRDRPACVTQNRWQVDFNTGRHFAGMDFVASCSVERSHRPDLRTAWRRASQRTQDDLNRHIRVGRQIWNAEACNESKQVSSIQVDDAAPGESDKLREGTPRNVCPPHSLQQIDGCKGTLDAQNGDIPDGKFIAVGKQQVNRKPSFRDQNRHLEPITSCRRVRGGLHYSSYLDGAIIKRTGFQPPRSEFCKCMRTKEFSVWAEMNRSGPGIELQHYKKC
jgi:hypothetical protein